MIEEVNGTLILKDDEATMEVDKTTGFVWIGEKNYDGDFFWCNYDPRSSYPNAERVVKCSQSLLQRWLREEHSLYVMLEATETLSLKSGIGFYYKIIKVKDKEHLRLDCSMYFYKTYEEALEAGLKEGLRLI